jgi:RimJ/RimL family protein N-acetyltransferase
MIQAMGANNYPEMVSERLRLRAFTAADADAVTDLAGDRAIAATTLSIPHPYARGDAEQWIASHQEAFVDGRRVSLAITLLDGAALIGAISLMLDGNNRRAELGYWVGQPFWGHGYATEAARTMLDFGFEGLGLNRIFAHHMEDNPASGRVLSNIGMEPEGVLRQHILKWDEFKDVVLFGLTRERFRAINPPRGDGDD